jgi:hypothetical protein
MMENFDPIFACPLDPVDQGPEFELMLTCCRPIAQESDLIKQRKLAKENLDIQKIIDLARRHKISALVYCNLKTHPIGTFDPQLMQELAVRYQNNSNKAVKSLQAIHQIARTKPSYLVTILKGLDVAIRAYGDLAVRDVGDIDLLVAPEYASEFYALLETQGWTSNMSTYRYLLTSKILRNSHHEMTLFRANFPRLELHWRPTYNPHELSMRYLSKASFSTQANTGLNGFNNEDLLIYLCIHGSKHGWGRLKWLFDLPNVIERIELDWHSLWQRADYLGVSFAVQQALLLSSKYCGVNLTERMLAGFRYKISRAQWSSIRQFQSGPEIWMEYPPTQLAIHIWLNRIFTATNPRIWTWHFLSMFNPSINDYELIKLPKKIEPLYFLLRPFTWGIRRIKIWKRRTISVHFPTNRK